MTSKRLSSKIITVILAIYVVVLAYENEQNKNVEVLVTGSLEKSVTLIYKKYLTDFREIYFRLVKAAYGLEERLHLKEVTKLK